MMFSKELISDQTQTAGAQLVYVNEAMDWFSAWSYCKEKFTDLTTRWKDVQSLVSSGEIAWVGCIAHPQIYWSDGSSSSFRYWDDFPKLFGSMNMMYGAADLHGSGKWRLLLGEETFPSVCYSISEVPIPSQTNDPQVELKKEKGTVELKNSTINTTAYSHCVFLCVCLVNLWMSSSVDLNGSALKTDILTQVHLQNPFVY